MKAPRTNGFTLIELLVVIGIIALLASIAVPAFTSVQIRAAQTKGISNAKQIGLCCKQFAIDNNGQYPSYEVTNGSTSATQVVVDSNSAFCQLFPTYLSTISIFYMAKSSFTPTLQSDPDMTQASNKTSPWPLPAGTNEWAYVTGLYDTSSSTYPLLADGFNTVGPPPAYINSENSKGGVWKGQQTIVCFCDDSVKLIKLNQSNYTVPGPVNNDLFDTSGQQGWLAAPAQGSTGGNTVVNPL